MTTVTLTATDGWYEKSLTKTPLISVGWPVKMMMFQQTLTLFITRSHCYQSQFEQ